jgi:hypothetical protein
MHRTRLLVTFIACLPFGGTLPLLRGQSPNLSVQQQLRSQYRVASVDGNGSVVRAGSVLVVAQDGLKANPPSAAGCWYNSHKPGNRIKYSTFWEATTPADLRNQVRLLQVGEKVVVIQLDAKPSEVLFCVQTDGDNPNGVPYRAAVWFQFQQKNYVQPANLKAIQDSIAEVFSLDTARPPESAVPAPQLEQVAGRYVMREAPDNQFQLNADGTFSLVQLGKTYSGTFRMDGNKFIIHQTGVRAPRAAGTIQGDTLIDPDNSVWVKQKAAPAAAVPTIAPLRLPSTYVSAQTAADQLQLNADNSFSLQEGGQTYRGTFAVSGNILDINISDGAKTTMTIQGSNLTDPSGQTWALRDQSEGTAPSGAQLQNEDVIKMVKAGLDDAIIIAKIGGSKCQFDTSTDALIRLKQSGVSAAVLKAILR